MFKLLHNSTVLTSLLPFKQNVVDQPIAEDPVAEPEVGQSTLEDDGVSRRGDVDTEKGKGKDGRNTSSRKRKDVVTVATSVSPRKLRRLNNPNYKVSFNCSITLLY
jgi:hypothetical protein